MNINFTLFSQAMAFAIFIWFTVRFVWPPLMRAIENRQKTIADGLAAGERGKQELELGKPTFRRCSEGSQAAGGRYHCASGETCCRDCRGGEERLQRTKVIEFSPAQRQRSSRKYFAPGKHCGSRWRIWRWRALRRFCAAKWTPRRTPICLHRSKRNSKQWPKLALSRDPMPKPCSGWPRRTGDAACLVRDAATGR